MQVHDLIPAVQCLKRHHDVPHQSSLSKEACHDPVHSFLQAYTLEVCMTGLHPEKAAQFARGPDFVSAEATTDASGIRALLPAAKIDDYV